MKILYHSMTFIPAIISPIEHIDQTPSLTSVIYVQVFCFSVDNDHLDWQMQDGLTWRLRPRKQCDFLATIKQMNSNNQFRY